ncbi:hypothetical protein [Winogradskyella sp.]|uniref:hypothetical protein n=1 Tax=Winogradskyella sp. TaxID=1883156 RepID=UPI002620A9F3|nr:hypothetical protein [Winogradskyella sp.]
MKNLNKKKLPYISLVDFLEKAKDSKAYSNGCIEIWGDSIGRPGDNLYSISDIEVPNQRTLKINLGHGNIKLIDPKEFYCDNTSLIVNTSSEVIWEMPLINLKLYYLVEKKFGDIMCNSTIGEHTFKIDKEKPSFKMYF